MLEALYDAGHLVVMSQQQKWTEQSQMEMCLEREVNQDV